jgi:deoxyribonuclease V
MRLDKRHEWQVTIGQAQEVQRRLAPLVVRRGEITSPRFIAGADISSRRGAYLATGAVVVLDYPGLRPVEIKVVKAHPDLPYIPGLLSFREAPIILAACEALTITPDLLIVDGQGIAHPRRLGIAAHLGLWLNIPTIGCAKSLLCGEYEEPAVSAGSYCEITDKGETIGAVLRTRSGVKPVFVSIGHRLSLESAIHWVLQCCRGYRLPEPQRLAHQAAGGGLGLQQMTLNHSERVR